MCLFGKTDMSQKRMYRLPGYYEIGKEMLHNPSQIICKQPFVHNFANKGADREISFVLIECRCGYSCLISLFLGKIKKINMSCNR